MTRRPTSEPCVADADKHHEQSQHAAYCYRREPWLHPSPHVAADEPAAAERNADTPVRCDSAPVASGQEHGRNPRKALCAGDLYPRDCSLRHLL